MNRVIYAFTWEEEGCSAKTVRLLVYAAGRNNNPGKMTFVAWGGVGVGLGWGGRIFDPNVQSLTIQFFNRSLKYLKCQ